MSRVARGVSLLMAATVTTLLTAGCGKEPAAQHYPREKLLDPKTCNECHQDSYNEWSGSMHAYAATDPLFLAMNKRGQAETHGALGNFCVNCHAPMAVHELAGDNRTIDPETIPDQLKGVTCYFCHNVTAVAGTHNNALVLADDTTMRGPISNAVPYKAHDAADSPLHNGATRESADLCGACHDIVVPAHFSGAIADPEAGVGPEGVRLEQTYSEWFGSTLSKGDKFQTCGGCHMSSVPGTQPIATLNARDAPALIARTRHRHDFPAVDTAFATPDFPAQLNEGSSVRAAQEERVTKALDGELRVETCVDYGNGPTTQGSVRVTLENIGAGHNFPSGASQDRRLWIELHVSERLADGSERDAYQSGVVPQAQSVTDAEEAATKAGDVLYLFRDQTTKLDGTPAHMFWDVARIESKTVPVATTKQQPPVNTRDALYGVKLTQVARPTRVTVTVWFEPIGLDVIDDLAKSGYLPESDGAPHLRELMPRRALLPNHLTDPDAEAPIPVTLEWSYEKVIRQETSNSTTLCLSTQ
jgi:hypothetical protein